MIGIIAILIAVLLPALAKARQQANKLSCLANLRQVGNLMGMYVNAYRGSFPEGLSPDNGSAWGALLSTMMHVGDGTIASALTADTVKSREMFICKDATEILPLPPNQYSCHPLLMPDMSKTYPATFPVTALQGKQRVPYKITRIHNSSEIAIIWDGNQRMDNGGANRMR